MEITTTREGEMREDGKNWRALLVRDRWGVPKEFTVAGTLGWRWRWVVLLAVRLAVVAGTVTAFDVGVR